MAAVLERSESVRRYGTGDDAFIERLSTLAFGDFDGEAAAHTRSLVRKPSAQTRVAVRGSERLGFVVVELGAGTSWVQAIAVASRERGRGLGALLMAEAERVAREAGARTLSLTTAQANVEALELFMKRGFRIERRLPRFYGRGQDACVLALAL